MTTDVKNHRIWKFIEQAQEKGLDVIDFYRPVSKLADLKYEKICQELNTLGYTTNDMTNPNGNSLSSILRVGNLLNNKIAEDGWGKIMTAQRMSRMIHSNHNGG